MSFDMRSKPKNRKSNKKLKRRRKSPKKLAQTKRNST